MNELKIQKIEYHEPFDIMISDDGEKWDKRSAINILDHGKRVVFNGRYVLITHDLNVIFTAYIKPLPPKQYWDSPGDVPFPRPEFRHKDKIQSLMPMQINTSGILFHGFTIVWDQINQMEYTTDGGKTWNECTKEESGV